MPEPKMVAGKWYDLDPPAVVLDKFFPRVYCQYRVPNDPDKYCVKGYPGGISDGTNTMEPFVLIFTSQGRARKVTLSDDQGGP